VADFFRTGSGWRAAALAANGIEMLDIELDDEMLDGLVSATNRQFR